VGLRPKEVGISTDVPAVEFASRRGLQSLSNFAPSLWMGIRRPKVSDA